MRDPRRTQTILATPTGVGQCFWAWLGLYTPNKLIFDLGSQNNQFTKQTKTIFNYLLRRPPTILVY